MPEGWRLHLLKLLPRVLINMVFIYKPRISQHQHLQKKRQKKVGWVTISHSHRP